MKYIFCLGIWICFVLKDVYLILCFSIIFSIYLYIRFKKKFIVLLWFLCSCCVALLIALLLFCKRSFVIFVTNISKKIEIKECSFLKKTIIRIYEY